MCFSPSGRDAQRAERDLAKAYKKTVTSGSRSTLTQTTETTGSTPQKTLLSDYKGSYLQFIILRYMGWFFVQNRRFLKASIFHISSPFIYEQYVLYLIQS